MSDLIDTILTSETGQRMVESVVNIYDNAYVGLWLFQAIGIEHDRWWAITDELKQQTRPETATWSLCYWEQRYGLPTDETLPYSVRRPPILEKRRNRGPFTPRRVINLAESMTGLPARVVERIGPYSFGVYLTAPGSNDEALLRELRRIKPAHMSLEIEYEQSVGMPLYFASALQKGIKFKIGQVN